MDKLAPSLLKDMLILICTVLILFVQVFQQLLLVQSMPLKVPKDLPAEEEEKVQLLLSGMIVSLQTIEESYSDYIKITFK